MNTRTTFIRPTIATLLWCFHLCISPPAFGKESPSILESSRLTLTPIMLADTDELHQQLFGVGEAMKTFNTGRTLSREEVYRRVRSWQRLQNDTHKTLYKVWRIDKSPRQSNEQLAGLIGISDLSQASHPLLYGTFKGYAEVYIVITPNEWGKGFAPEAVLEAAHYTVQRNQQTQGLLATITPQNKGSIRAFSKVGFKKSSHMTYIAGAPRHVYLLERKKIQELYAQSKLKQRAHGIPHLS